MQTSERNFLEGPKNFWLELRFALRAFLEFFNAVRRFHSLGPCITFFGSAKLGTDSPYYDLARKCASELAKNGFSILSGGGPGIMEAANRGAREAKGPSLACNIILPHEQVHNKFIDVQYTTKYFFVRKVILFKYSYGFVVLPGGIGTLDELLEVLTLVRTGKGPQVPIVLMGRDYWKTFLDLIEDLIAKGMAEKSDRELFFVSDSIEEMLEHIKAGAVHKRSRFRILKYEISGQKQTETRIH